THFGIPFRYPGEGCSQITSTLASAIQAAGGKIELGIRLDKIYVDTVEKRAICETSEGLIYARKIVIGSRAHAAIYADGKPVKIDTETTIYRSVVVLIRGQKVFDFGYVEVIGDRVIKRARDVGV